MGKSFSCERGAVIPLVLVTILTLLGLIAFCLNIGHFVYIRSEAQRAVDSAALAAASAMPHYNSKRAIPGQRFTKVTPLLEGFNGATNVDKTNAVDGVNPDIHLADSELITYDFNTSTLTTVPAGDRADGIRVKKTYPVSNWLSSIVGDRLWNFNVRASAIMASVKCSASDLPIMLTDCPGDVTFGCDAVCDSNIVYTLAVQAGGSVDTAGYYSYPPDSASANLCRTMVANMPANVLCAGDTINLLNGQADSCLKDIEDKCEQDFACCDGNLNNPCNWIVTVPVVTCGTQLNQSTSVLGFVRLGIVDVRTQGNPKYISFRRLCDTVDKPGGASLACGLKAFPLILVE